MTYPVGAFLPYPYLAFAAPEIAKYLVVENVTATNFGRYSTVASPDIAVAVAIVLSITDTSMRHLTRLRLRHSNLASWVSSSTLCLPRQCLQTSPITSVISEVQAPTPRSLLPQTAPGQFTSSEVNYLVYKLSGK